MDANTGFSFPFFVPNRAVGTNIGDRTGASRVFFFDHRTRYGPSDWHSLGKGNVASRGPLMRAHVDQSYDGAELLLRRLFPDEADELVKRRYQIINVSITSKSRFGLLRLFLPKLFANRKGGEVNMREIAGLATHQNDSQRPACGDGCRIGAGRGPRPGLHYLPRVPERVVDGTAEQHAPVVLQIPTGARRGVADQVLRFADRRGPPGPPLRLRGSGRGGSREPTEHRGASPVVLRVNEGLGSTYDNRAALYVSDKPHAHMWTFPLIPPWEYVHNQ